MSSTVRPFRLAAAFVFSLVLALVASGPLFGQAKPNETAKAAPAAPQTTLWAPGELKWVGDPTAPDVHMATLWGDPTKGAYGALLKFKAGMEIPLHTHTYENKGVVVSGTLVITLEGQKPKELGPGSYVLLPGDVKHITACKPGEDCVIFAEQPGLSDTKFVEKPAAK